MRLHPQEAELPFPILLLREKGCGILSEQARNAEPREAGAHLIGHGEDLLTTVRREAGGRAAVGDGVHPAPAATQKRLESRRRRPRVRHSSGACPRSALPCRHHGAHGAFLRIVPTSASLTDLLKRALRAGTPTAGPQHVRDAHTQRAQQPAESWGEVRSQLWHCALSLLFLRSTRPPGALAPRRLRFRGDAAPPAHCVPSSTRSEASWPQVQSERTLGRLSPALSPSSPPTATPRKRSRRLPAS